MSQRFKGHTAVCAGSAHPSQDRETCAEAQGNRFLGCGGVLRSVLTT